MSFLAEHNEPEACIGCGLTHSRVEAAGIWHCPNPLCKATGAAYVRSLVPSHEMLPSGKHTVACSDMVNLGRWLLQSSEPWSEYNDPKEEEALRAAVTSSIGWWEEMKNSLDNEQQEE